MVLTKQTYNTQDKDKPKNKHKNPKLNLTKPDLVTYYDIWPGNKSGPF